MTNILITGSRDWDDEKTIGKAIQNVEALFEKPYMLIHGNCKGADKLVASYVQDREGWSAKIFETDHETYGKKACAKRNQNMVDQKPNYALIFCSDIKNSKGVKDCWKRIVKANITHDIYPKTTPVTKRKRFTYADLGPEGPVNLIDFVDERWHSVLDMDEVKDMLGEVQEELVPLARKQTIYPLLGDVFNVLKCDPASVKVVIIGQDPYMHENQAHGYAFSDNSGDVAPSLKNIFKVIRKNGYSPQKRKREDEPDGNLQCWVDQGVFMINTLLTVADSKPLSHSDVGWQDFTNHVIRKLANHGDPKVFLLWGAQAKKFSSMCAHAKVKNLVLTTSHPSPLGAMRGFLDCNHFREANDFLETHKREPIEW